MLTILAQKCYSSITSQHVINPELRILLREDSYDANMFLSSQKDPSCLSHTTVIQNKIVAGKTLH